MKGKPNNRRRGGPRQFAAKVVAAMSAGIVQSDRLALTLGISEQEVAAWMAKPKNMLYVVGLLRCNDVATQVLASAHKPEAVARLITTSRRDDLQPEVTRKSCMDVIRLSHPESLLIESSSPIAKLVGGVNTFDPMGSTPPTRSSPQLLRELDKLAKATLARAS